MSLARMDSKACVRFVASEVSQAYGVTTEEAMTHTRDLVRMYMSQASYQAVPAPDFLCFALSVVSCHPGLQTLRAALDAAGPYSVFDDHEAFEESRSKWDVALERLADDHNATGNRIFRCRRCRGSRVTVTTVQIRSADEGMTEFRTCKDCGHVGRINA